MAGSENPSDSHFREGFATGKANPFTRSSFLLEPALRRESL